MFFFKCEAPNGLIHNFCSKADGRIVTCTDCTHVHLHVSCSMQLKHMLNFKNLKDTGFALNILALIFLL